MVTPPHVVAPEEYVLDHVGIAVADIEEGSRPWRALGLAVAEEETLENEGVAARFFDLGSTRLELIAPLRDESPISRFLQRRGSGLHHLAFRVTDIVAELALLKSRHASLIDLSPRPGFGGSQVAFVHPSWAGGVLIELVQAP